MDDLIKIIFDKLAGLKIKCERAGGYQEDEKVADAEEDLGGGGVDEVLLHVLAGIPAAELQVLSSQRNLLRKEECLVAICDIIIVYIRIREGSFLLHLPLRCIHSTTSTLDCVFQNRKIE